MSVSQWGPPTWIFFHTIVQRISEDKFPQLGGQLFGYIKRFCANLPCRDCSGHATKFLANVNFAGVRNKQDLINIMTIFHNTVNKRKSKPQFNATDLNIYMRTDLIKTYNDFAANFSTRGNMKLLADSFQRTVILNDFKKWFLANISAFK